MPKLHEPESGTSAEIDQGGTSLKEISSSPAYEHLMHKSHPAHKGGGFTSLGKGVCITGGSGSGGSQLSSGHTRTSTNKNKVMK